MIDKKDLKAGDKICMTYRESFAATPQIFPAVVKKVTDKFITAQSKRGTWDFNNDEEMGYIGLYRNGCQQFHLFLGNEDEARKHWQQIVHREELYNELREQYNRISEHRDDISTKTFERIIDVLKSVKV